MDSDMLTTHLQGIGLHNAKPAGDIQPGDVVVWNYGYSNPVVAVEPCGKTMVKVTYGPTSPAEGWTNKTNSTRRHRKTFLVGIA